MKKTLLLLLTVFMASSLVAMDDTRLKRKQDMQMLASGLKLLQDGLIYNNKTLLFTGVDMIEKGEKNLMSAHGESLKKYLPGDTAYAYKYAEKAAERIATYTKELSSDVKDKKDYTKISKTYSYIINECAGCHLRIRK
jgi:hypothetical protein